MHRSIGCILLVLAFLSIERLGHVGADRVLDARKGIHAHHHDGDKDEECDEQRGN